MWCPQRIGNSSAAVSWRIASSSQPELSVRACTLADSSPIPRSNGEKFTKLPNRTDYHRFLTLAARNSEFRSLGGIMMRTAVIAKPFSSLCMDGHVACFWISEL